MNLGFPSALHRMRVHRQSLRTMLLNLSHTNLEIHAKIQDSGVFHLTRSIRISKFFTILNFESSNNQREFELDNFYTNVVCGYNFFHIPVANDIERQLKLIPGGHAMKNIHNLSKGT